MRRLLLSLPLLAALSACDTSRPSGSDAAEQTTAAQSATASAAAMTPSDEVMQKWSRSCILCHVDGNGGAPRLGHAEEWQPRVARGRDVLLQHTLEGLNNMPPLGYCMSCERDDFVALIDFMSGGT